MLERIRFINLVFNNNNKNKDNDNDEDDAAADPDDYYDDKNEIQLVFINVQT